MNTEPIPLVVIHRINGVWAIVIGSHDSPTPWKDSAAADQVVRWIRDTANGKVQVKVEL